MVITDTSVLVNFLRIDRMDLIARNSHRFMITDHVMEEITDRNPEQQARLNTALADGTLEVITVSGDVDYQKTTPQLAAGLFFRHDDSRIQDSSYVS